MHSKVVEVPQDKPNSGHAMPNLEVLGHALAAKHSRGLLGQAGVVVEILAPLEVEEVLATTVAPIEI